MADQDDLFSYMHRPRVCNSNWTPQNELKEKFRADNAHLFFESAIPRNLDEISFLVYIRNAIKFLVPGRPARAFVEDFIQEMPLLALFSYHILKETIFY